jgi:hypothetical protein
MKRLRHSTSVVSRLFGFSVSIMFFSGMFLTSAWAEVQVGAATQPSSDDYGGQAPEPATVVDSNETPRPAPVLETGDGTPPLSGGQSSGEADLGIIEAADSRSESASESITEEFVSETVIETDVDADVELVQTILDGDVVEELIVNGEKVTESVVVTILDGDVEVIAKEESFIDIPDADVDEVDADIEDDADVESGADVTDVDADVEDDDRILIDVQPSFLVADIAASDEVESEGEVLDDVDADEEPDIDSVDDALEQVIPTPSALASEEDDVDSDADETPRPDEDRVSPLNRGVTEEDTENEEVFDETEDDDDLDEDEEYELESFSSNAGEGNGVVADERRRHLGPFDGTFRITEYYVTIDDFSGTTYDLALDYALADDYFILVRGSRTGGGRSNPDNDYARIYQVPGGRGDLADSGANNVISLSRHQAAHDWEGVVTVVESLTDVHASGFRLLDVVETSVIDDATSGIDSSSVPWGSIDQVVPFGGYRGGGAEFEADAKRPKDGDVVYTRLYPSGSDILNWERVDNGGQPLCSMTMTTFVVEWGAQWQVQHVQISGDNAGPSANKTKHYAVSTIDPVLRRNTWVWGTGMSTGDGVGEDSEATLITLGDGVNQNELETSVAMGSATSAQRDFDIYVMTHADLVNNHIFKPNGNKRILDLNLPTYPAPPGTKLSLAYSACQSASSAHPICRFWSRYIDDDWITISRGYAGKKFAAWVQGIDFSQIKPTVSQGVTVDIVDASGQSITNPLVIMDDVGFGFTDEISNGVLGVIDGRIRLSNPGSTTTWSVSIAPTDGAQAFWWDGAINFFNFNNSNDGQLTVNPSVGSVARADGGDTTGVILGIPRAFEENVTDEITLFSSASAQPHQDYDLLGVSLSQIIPALQPEGDYVIKLTLTAI